VDTAKTGVSATDRKVGQGATAERNRSAAAGQKAPYKLEDSRTRPSRKTTRQGANRMRQDAQLRKRQMVSSRSPSKRAFKNTARKRGAVRRRSGRRRRARRVGARHFHANGSHRA
jgi:hypothetical protein